MKQFKPYSTDEFIHWTAIIGIWKWIKHNSLKFHQRLRTTTRIFWRGSSKAWTVTTWVFSYPRGNFAVLAQTHRQSFLTWGGAAGAYSLWLARKGYQVNLVDLVPHFVDKVPRQSDGSKHQFSTCQVGDARKLEFEDCSANGVLLLGPQQKNGSKQLILPFSN